jgi:DUF971 family protein
MNQKKNRPTRIDIDAAAAELVIVWKDGSESRSNLVDLRKNCPCATCRELRQQEEPAADSLELNLLSDTAITATAQAQSFDYVGRYGIRINWADGHNYGIYTFASFRQEDEEGTE